MGEVLARGEYWWQAWEVFLIYPTGETVTTWIGWLRDFRMGRKRLWDSMLAATCAEHSISVLICNNAADCEAFKKFTTLNYAS